MKTDWYDGDTAEEAEDNARRAVAAEGGRVLALVQTVPTGAGWSTLIAWED